MSDETPRRVKNQPPEAPTGYRSTRRASKALKNAKRAERQHEVSTVLGRIIKTVRDIGYYLALGVGVLLVGLLVLLLVARAINGIARWVAARGTSATTAQSEVDRRARENLLVIGEEAGKATGFLAVRVSRTDQQIYGIAIPDGAFIEVPGQGFERVGESYAIGPEVSMSAISNYLTVQFRSYVVVPASVYQQAIKSQSVAGVLAATKKSNLTTDTRTALQQDIAAIPKPNTAIVPLPVQPVKLGNTTYFEPQKAQVADLLTKWWGIDPSKVAQVTRVILYNGVGTPGIAGDAAQQLIRAGLRVVDTKNADNFNYGQTLIVVQRGSSEQGNQIAKTLGVGQVRSKPSDQDIADVIVIIGRDYKPPTGGSTGGTK
jgi:LytR cell envelope-related transcriptional attenuator